MKLVRRLNKSYQKLYRNRHLFAGRLDFDDAEYRLWDLYIALYDWDKNHNETFETVEATDRKLAEILLWSASKVCRVRNRLLKKGVIKTKKRGIYEIVLIPKGNESVASVQKKIAISQSNPASTQQKSAEVQQISGYSRPTSLVSYKDKYRFINTEEVYKGIQEKIEELGKKIGDNWLSEEPESKRLVDEHQRLAGLMLNYEIENDLLPI